jgi:hypothetical protein
LLIFVDNKWLSCLMLKKTWPLANAFGRLSVNNNPCFYNLLLKLKRFIFITRSKFAFSITLYFFDIHHSNLIVSHLHKTYKQRWKENL